MAAHVFKSVHEVLEVAIHREAQAHQFYMKLASMAQNAEMARVLEARASEEVSHMAKLEAIRDGDEQFENDLVTNTGVADAVHDVAIHPAMNYTDLLLVGIRKEDRSCRLYNKLAAAALTDGVRGTLLQMAREEAEHKLRFEFEYELATFGAKK